MPTHTRLSLQPKSREPRKTAGGIRGQRKAGVRSQTAVTAMPLKMRPTGLGSGIDKDGADYTVFTGEWEVGRIYETRVLYPMDRVCRRETVPHPRLISFFDDAWLPFSRASPCRLENLPVSCLL